MLQVNLHCWHAGGSTWKKCWVCLWIDSVQDGRTARVVPRGGGSESIRQRAVFLALPLFVTVSSWFSASHQKQHPMRCCWSFKTILYGSVCVFTVSSNVKFLLSRSSRKKKCLQKFYRGQTKLPNNDVDLHFLTDDANEYKISHTECFWRPLHLPLESIGWRTKGGMFERGRKIFSSSVFQVDHSSGHHISFSATAQRLPKGFTGNNSHVPLRSKAKTCRPSRKVFSVQFSVLILISIIASIQNSVACL